MFTPLGTPALITASQTVISTPNKGQASIIPASSFKHFTSVSFHVHVHDCEAHLSVEDGLLYTLYSDLQELSSVHRRSHAPKYPPTTPQPPRPHSPSPAIFLLRCNHLNLNPSCSEVEVFSWERFCLSLPPQDTLQCLEISELTSTEDSHALLVLAVSLRSGAVVSLSSPSYTYSSHGPPCTGPARGMRPSSSPCIGIR